MSTLLKLMAAVAIAGAWIGGVLADVGGRVMPPPKCSMCRERWAHWSCADCSTSLCLECVCGHACGVVEVES